MITRMPQQYSSHRASRGGPQGSRQGGIHSEAASLSYATGSRLMRDNYLLWRRLCGVMEDLRAQNLESVKACKITWQSGM